MICYFIKSFQKINKSVAIHRKTANMQNISLKEGFLGQKMLSLPKSTMSVVRDNKITKAFYVSDLGHYPTAAHHYRYRKKGAKQYIFIYCTKGNGIINLENTVHIIQPNQFFIIPKNVAHEYKADDAEPWSIFWFHFDGSIAKKLYNRFSERNIVNFKNAPFSASRLKIFSKIFDLFQGSNQDTQLEYANLLSLNFISSFVYNDSEIEPNDKNGDDIVEAIKTFLLNNLEKNHTLEEIAKKFNYSKSHLHTKFKKKTGYPVMVFYNLKKIQRACEYLNYTDLSIKEISFKIGFQDPLYFSRIFKSFMGKSPRNYKKSQVK